MVNPLTAVVLIRRRSLRRRHVPVPAEAGSTDAIFMALRRMRAPLLWLVAIFTSGVAGLAATPGVDEQGRPVNLTVFESFYVMSYTATTIGFGEIPREFTTGQRLWVTFMIYATVIGWAITIGSILSLVQDDTFTTAVATQRFGRKVRRLREPFLLIAGYGETGRAVCRRLDDFGRPFVVVDGNRSRIDHLRSANLSVDALAVVGQVQDPAVLGLAGLRHTECVGVLALTDDNDANLAVVEAVSLLRPDLAILARVSDADVERQMRHFGAVMTINPLDQFGNLLVLSLQRPAVYQLVVWLTSPRGGRLPERGTVVPGGLWTVAAEGEFRECVEQDLRRAGYDVRMVDPDDRAPDVHDAVGCVVATLRDSTNLAIAAHVRRVNPDAVICMRQVHVSARPLVAAFAPERIFVPSDFVAREALAQVLTPRGWAFIEHALEQDDAWADALVSALSRRCGEWMPTPSLLTIDEREAPAVVHWIAGRAGREPVTVGHLTRDALDREAEVPVVVLMHIRGEGRGEQVTFLPEDSMVLEIGDRLLVVSGRGGSGLMRDVLFHDSAIEYVVTGRHVPETWIWRKLAQRAGEKRGAR